MLVDKSTWGLGPWQAEQDRVEFRAHGFPCILKRHSSSGHWCMYVGVPQGHPWHGKGCMDLDIEIHGGVTFGAPCDGDPVNGVCHTPQYGEPEHAWWIGADFAHCDDMSPGSVARLRSYGACDSFENDHYWTEAEVHAECEDFARQAKEARDAHS